MGSSEDPSAEETAPELSVRENHDSLTECSREPTCRK
jgi:hypothetical protein